MSPKSRECLMAFGSEPVECQCPGCYCSDSAAWLTRGRPALLRRLGEVAVVSVLSTGGEA